MSIDYYLLATIRTEQTDFPYLDNTTTENTKFLRYSKELESARYPIFLRIWFGNKYDDMNGKRGYKFSLVPIQLTTKILNDLKADLESGELFKNVEDKPDEWDIYNIKTMIKRSESAIEDGAVVYLCAG